MAFNKVYRNSNAFSSMHCLGFLRNSNNIGVCIPPRKPVTQSVQQHAEEPFNKVYRNSNAFSSMHCLGFLRNSNNIGVCIPPRKPVTQSVQQHAEEQARQH